MIRRMLSRALLGILAVIAVPVIFSAFVAAQEPELSEAHLEKIRQNCITAQVTMQRVQQSDIATRINYGQAYDSLLTRLMTPLNSRTVVARVEIAPRLAEQTKLFSDKVDTFRDNYAAYTTALTSTIRMKCQEKPAEFYEATKRAGELRSQLAQDIEAINTIMREYEKITADYLKSLQEGSDQ